MFSGQDYSSAGGLCCPSFSQRSGVTVWERGSPHFLNNATRGGRDRDGEERQDTGGKGEAERQDSKNGGQRKNWPTNQF